MNQTLKMAYYQCKELLITNHKHIQSNTLKNKILYLHLQKPKFCNYGKLYQIRLGNETSA